MRRRDGRQLAEAIAQLCGFLGRRLFKSGAVANQRGAIQTAAGRRCLRWAELSVVATSPLCRCRPRKELASRSTKLCWSCVWGLVQPVEAAPLCVHVCQSARLLQEPLCGYFFSFTNNLTFCNNSSVCYTM